MSIEYLESIGAMASETVYFKLHPNYKSVYRTLEGYDTPFNLDSMVACLCLQDHLDNIHVLKQIRERTQRFCLSSTKGQFNAFDRMAEMNVASEELTQVYHNIVLMHKLDPDRYSERIREGLTHIGNGLNFTQTDEDFGIQMALNFMQICQCYYAPEIFRPLLFLAFPRYDIFSHVNRKLTTRTRSINKDKLFTYLHRPPMMDDAVRLQPPFRTTTPFDIDFDFNWEAVGKLQFP